MNVTPAAPLDPALSDQLLRLAPVNVLLLDTDLVCRYAAPVGDTLAGRSRDDLFGRPVAEILPPARNGLRPALEEAARDARSWQEAEYRFRDTSGGGDRPCCWSVKIDPVASDDFRGVLVTWTEIERQAEERDAMRREVDRLRAQASERNAALISLLSDLRNAITPLSGYLQVMARRPETLHGRSITEVIEGLVLPRIADLLAVIDRLHRPPIYTQEPDSAGERREPAAGPQ